MADALLSAVAERIVALIEEQAVYHINLVRGAEEEVRSLAKELNTIRNVLDDAENRRFQNKSINSWLWKLRQTAYKMEDILDEWKYALLKLHKGKHAAPPKQKVCSFIPSSSFCLCFKKTAVRHEIAKKILNVKAQLDEILEEGKKYGFKIFEPTADPLPVSRRDQSTSLVDLGEVHGRDGDGDILVNKLTGNGGSQEEPGIQVVSIVGVGGLGKTTLAQLVYNHSRVVASFDPRIWICVSDPFDLAAIAKGILEKIERGRSRDADQLDDLFTRVRECISGKKFLLVLDDVWTEDYNKWKPLENLLRCGGAGSKILVTTRSRRVALTMGTRDSEIFQLGMLSDEDCWLVLCRMARLERNRVEFENVGKKIAQKCSGLPLAAKTLGSLLRFKSSLEEWKNVLNSEIWGMQEAEVELFPHLLMSYKELTPTQKQCFSYCAVFPKDSEIVVETLIGSWMALGYLGSNSSDMELKGKECFDILAMRSLFQDFRKDRLDEIKRCKMHDIVHDFAQFLRKSGGVEAAEMNKSAPCRTCDPSQVSNVNEFCTLYRDKESPPNLCNCLLRLRVLSLKHCGLQSIPHGMDNLIRLRWLDLRRNKLSTEGLEIIFQLYFLQTLNLSGCSLEEISKEIENLSDLRHVDLSFNELKELPSETGNLRQLRHLDLSGNELKKLPSEIGNLKQLRHLDLSFNKLKELPSEIGKLILLQTLRLPKFGTPCRIPESLTQLSGLRELTGFKGGSGWSKLGLLKNLNQLVVVELEIRLDNLDLKGIVEDAREAELSNKVNIEYLDLSFDGEEESSWMDVIDALAPHPNLRVLNIDNYLGSKLPLWIVSPSNQLRKVHLQFFSNLTSLPSLGKLPCLEEILIFKMAALEFVGREFLGITTNSTTNFVAFPKLKTLNFQSCSNWKEWEDITTEEEESPAFQVMPCLTQLAIVNCDALTALPHRLLRKASSLEILYLIGSKKLEQRYGNKDGSDWKSISLNNPHLQLLTKW